MKVLALIGIRNEELYLERCIRHLVAQGIECCIIDNESDDHSRDIAGDYLGRGVTQIIPFPFPGYYNWSGMLSFKEQLAMELDADWFIHHDADEIRYSQYGLGLTLHDALEAEDVKGFNAVNFNEFVFVPTSEQQCTAGEDYTKKMQQYYYFQPRPHHRLTAWKKTIHRVDLKSTGGHMVSFPDIKISPVDMALCHYVLLNDSHFQEKYRNRKYSEAELAMGWHGNRPYVGGKPYRSPDPEALRFISNDMIMNTEYPVAKHFFLDFN